ncbi:hypothetical protein MBGDF03_00641 [Thermoplasmatales archaeon SCGC AB-540-F20]|nr:hypothetical protein MBGDF03_00641 [Thermoplasmatales archaeon SCGC AB-540-F20]
MSEIIKRVANELKKHAPFTFFGALTGIIIMLVLIFGNFLPNVSPISQNIFFILHPTHVLLSALVTTTLYMRYGKRKIWLTILIGYTGSIGIATMSDSIIPYLGEVLLDLPNPGVHIGFIEEPLLTNTPAFVGILIGYWKGTTKFPHAGHVLVSTWASLFHIIMALGATVSGIQTVGIFIFLFLAVWLPCCTSDIVYPLLFARKTKV